MRRRRRPVSRRRVPRVGFADREPACISSRTRRRTRREAQLYARAPRDAHGRPAARAEAAAAAARYRRRRRVRGGGGGTLSPLALLVRDARQRGNADAEAAAAERRLRRRRRRSRHFWIDRTRRRSGRAAHPRAGRRRARRAGGGGGGACAISSRRALAEAASNRGCGAGGPPPSSTVNRSASGTTAAGEVGAVAARWAGTSRLLPLVERPRPPTPIATARPSAERCTRRASSSDGNGLAYADVLGGAATAVESAPPVLWALEGAASSDSSPSCAPPAASANSVGAHARGFRADEPA